MYKFPSGYLDLASGHTLRRFHRKKALASGAPPQTPMGELTALPHTPWLDGRDAPLPHPPRVNCLQIATPIIDRTNFGPSAPGLLPGMTRQVVYMAADGLLAHCASWHKSCHLKYNNDKLMQAIKRGGNGLRDDSEDDRRSIKRHAEL